jgi:hypothetical protein
MLLQISHFRRPAARFPIEAARASSSECSLSATERHAVIRIRLVNLTLPLYRKIVYRSLT